MVCFFGRLPGMAVLSFTGASADSNVLLAKTVFSIAMIVALFICLLDEEIEMFFLD